MFHAIMALYDIVSFIEFVLDLGTVEKTPGDIFGGVRVCVRAVRKLTIETICDFQTHECFL